MIEGFYNDIFEIVWTSSKTSELLNPQIKSNEREFVKVNLKSRIFGRDRQPIDELQYPKELQKWVFEPNSPAQSEGSMPVDIFNFENFFNWIGLFELK